MLRFLRCSSNPEATRRLVSDVLPRVPQIRDAVGGGRGEVSAVGFPGAGARSPQQRGISGLNAHRIDPAVQKEDLAGFRTVPAVSVVHLPLIGRPRKVEQLPTEIREVRYVDHR